jgi:hypothetical protein
MVSFNEVFGGIESAGGVIVIMMTKFVFISFARIVVPILFFLINAIQNVGSPKNKIRH